MKVCGDIFRTCAVLHNMMLPEMVTEGQPSCLQRVKQVANGGGMWLEGPSRTLVTATERGDAR